MTMSDFICDPYGRRISYLRVAVTDACNMSCVYCTDECAYSSATPLPRDTLVHIIRVAAEYGITKVRLTGGEPLCAQDLLPLCRQLRTITAIDDLSLTTNATLLDGRAKALYDAGVRRFNISLDACDAQTFTRITGHDLFHDALRGLRDARRVCDNVRINVVLLRDINDANPQVFLDFAQNEGVTVRFLELMPTACNDHATFYAPAADFLARIRDIYGNITEEPHEPSSTAQWYRIPHGQRFGIIASVSAPFCATCNRLRLTADGSLLSCLHCTHSVSCADVTPSTPPDVIAQKLRDVAALRPAQHALGETHMSVCNMRTCGG